MEEDAGMTPVQAEAVATLCSLFGSCASRLAVLLRMLQDASAFQDLLPRSLLLFGPSGCGKASLVQGMCTALGIEMVSVDGDLMTEPVLPSGPRVVFLRRVEWAGGISSDDYVQRGHLLRLVNMVTKNRTAARSLPSLVICSASRVELLHPVLRAKFEEELRVPPPTRLTRPRIIEHHLQRLVAASAGEVLVSDVAQIAATVGGKCNGFLGCDISQMCAQAVATARLLYLETGAAVTLDEAAVDAARQTIVPSSLSHHIQISIPEVRWEQIGGLAEVKQKIQESIVWPYLHAGAYQRLGIAPVKGILLYGPPGTGKTMLAKAIATEANANFIATSISKLVHAVVGESERVLYEIFDRAKQSAPCIVFFDEIDAVFSSRGEGNAAAGCQQTISQLLLEMDDIRPNSHILVVGATNHPQAIDPGFLQSGRFEQLLLVPAPDKEARQEILRKAVAGMAVGGDVELEGIAASTDGFTGADLAHLCNAAGLLALRRDRQTKVVAMCDFEAALEKAVPSVTKEQASALAQWGGSKPHVPVFSFV